MDHRSTVPEERLNAVVERVVALAKPEKVILFGSAARGEMGPDSDIDLLVVVPPGVHRRKLAEELYVGLVGVGVPVDVVVVTSEDVARYAHSSGLVIEGALSEGKVVHAA